MGGGGGPYTTLRARSVSLPLLIFCPFSTSLSSAQYATWIGHLSALNAPLVFFGDAPAAAAMAAARAGRGLDGLTAAVPTAVADLACARAAGGMGVWEGQADL